MKLHKLALGLVILLVTAVMPARAQKITIDYAHDFDFDAVETFSYRETAKTDSQNPLMDSRIESAIVERLVSSGLEQAESDPDILVTYHFTAEENTVYDTTHFGYGGYYRGWGPWGVGVSTATTKARTYTKGTLVIDAYEPGENKMIWRGTGTVTVKDSPEKQAQQVDKILSKMGKKWRKILAGRGK